MRQRLTMGLVAILVLGLWSAKCGHRPALLPLATSVDGASPSKATRVLVMLHGHGGSGGTTDWIIDKLRQRGVGRDTSVVMVDGPFSSYPRRSWGDTQEERDESLARVRELIAGWRRVNPALLVCVAGFSRGADLAVRVAAHETAVSGLVAFSGCSFEDVPRLVARRDLAVTIVHGTDDQVCSNGSSRMLVAALRAAHHEVNFVEHAENHTIPPVGLDALARLLAR